MGGGREAMANDTHGVDVRKNREAPVCQKKVKKNRSDVELWREAYDSDPRMYQGYEIWKNRKANVKPLLGLRARLSIGVMVVTMAGM